MNKLYDILEVCLQEVENGMALETVLARHPDQAEELRPILQASIDARQMAAPAPSSDVVRRNRAKLLQHAAQMLEERPVLTKRWFPSFQRLAVALSLILLFFVSGTSLVRASSLALPGDSLYTVKRSWEDVTLFFAFNAEEHETLELEYENERLEEISELFASGRPAQVDFAGIVTRQNGDGWRIANILVIVSEQTDMPEQRVDIGAAVQVTGTTNGDGIVLAEQIELLPPGSPLPKVEDEPDEIEVEESPQATPQPVIEDSTPESSIESPKIEITMTPSPVSTPKIEAFEGILNSISKNIWTVNDILVNITNAEIKGVPVIGARAKVEGYYHPDGIFVATKIEIMKTGSSNDELNSNNNNDDEGSNTNSNNNNDDDSNSNSNGNDNSNDNSNDDHSNNDNNNNGG